MYHQPRRTVSVWNHYLCMFTRISFLVQWIRDSFFEDTYEKVELLSVFITQPRWAHSHPRRPSDDSYNVQCPPAAGRCGCNLSCRKGNDRECKLSTYPFQLCIIWEHMQRVSIGTDSSVFCLQDHKLRMLYIIHRYSNPELAHLSQQLPSEFKVCNILTSCSPLCLKNVYLPCFYCRCQWTHPRSGSWNMNSIQLILKHIKASRHS